MAITRPSGAPRWPVLLALVTLVLGVHLWLITGGGWPTWPSGGQTDSAPQTKAPVAPTVAPETSPAEPPWALAVEVSRVRWIPLPAVVAETPPSTPVARPRPAPVAKPSPLRPTEPKPTTGADNTSSPPAAAQAPEPPAPDADAHPTDVVDTAETPPVPEASEAPEPPAAMVAAAPAPSVPAGDSASPPAPITANPAPSVTLRYDIRGKAKGLNYSADAELQWRNEGERYNARMELKAFLVGSRTQTSVGQLGADGLAPERFGDRRRSAEKAVHFDPTGRRIRFSSNAPDATWQPGAQDRLSLFLQLGALLQARPDAYPGGSRIELLVAGTGGADVWRFELGPAESLSLPAGTVSARRLLRGPQHEHDSTVEIWLAPAHHHLPVRIRISEPDGSQADQQLRSLPQPTPP